MKTKMRYESSKYRAAADDLLLEVGQLMEKAEATFNVSERHELYKQAMERSNEAYNLIAKARELTKKEN